MKGTLVLVLITIATWWGAAAADIDEAAALVERAKEAVAYDMKDPSSAKFREVRVNYNKPGLRAVCGEVNGKNSYGAYAGFSRFYYKEGSAEPTTEIETGDDKFFRMGWKWWCTDHLKAKPES